MTDTNSGTVISQKLLAQNEDILAAIVENLQIGRLDDCIQHYMTLQNNLIQLATELDNYPTEEADAYEGLDAFPDEIVRRDPLEQFLTLEEKSAVFSPLIPSCDTCSQKNISAQECRVVLKHIEPSSSMTNLEKTELVHATQVVLARQKQLNGKSKEKRLYRRWTYEEIYTLEFAICLYGYNYAKIAEVYQDRAPQNRRTESQIKNFIRKRGQSNFQARPLDVLLNNPPAGYVPPIHFAPLFAARQSTNPNISQLTMSNADRGAAISSNGNTEEILVDRQNKNNFSVLIGIAAGYEFPDKKEEGKESSTNTTTATSSSNLEADIQQSKDSLVHLVKTNPASFNPSNPTANNQTGLLTAMNDPLLTSSIHALGTLTNQFIFPQSNLFEETGLNKSTTSSISNSTIDLTQSRPLENPTNLHRHSGIPGIATASEIVAATAAAEAAGIKLPSLSSMTSNLLSSKIPSATMPGMPPALTQTSSGKSFPGPVTTEDQSAAILRLKASNTKNRTEQAKLLLEYYQTYGYQNVPPFARPGLDKLKQKTSSQPTASTTTTTTTTIASNNNEPISVSKSPERSRSRTISDDIIINHNPHHNHNNNTNLYQNRSVPVTHLPPTMTSQPITASNAGAATEDDKVKRATTKSTAPKKKKQPNPSPAEVMAGGSQELLAELSAPNNAPTTTKAKAPKTTKPRKPSKKDLQQQQQQQQQQLYTLSAAQSDPMASSYNSDGLLSSSAIPLLPHDEHSNLHLHPLYDNPVPVDSHANNPNLTVLPEFGHDFSFL